MLKQFYWTRAAYFSKCTCSILGKLLFTLRCFWNIYTYLCNCVLLEPSRTERNRKDSTSSWTFFPCLLLVTINCSLHSSIYWGISLLSRRCYLELGAKDLKRQTAAHFPAQQNHYLQSRFWQQLQQVWLKPMDQAGAVVRTSWLHSEESRKAPHPLWQHLHQSKVNLTCYTKV